MKNIKNSFLMTLITGSVISLNSCKEITQVEEVYRYEVVEKPAGNENSGSAEGSIRVMSYDINYTNRAIKGTNTGVLDIEAVADVIKSNKADIVCMRQVDQFTNRGQMDVDQAKKLGELTGMNHFYAPVREVSQGKSGNAILSRYPILSSENMKLYTDPNDEARGAAIAVVDVGKGKKLKVVSIQLEFSKENNRLTQIDELKDKLKQDDTPLVLAGNMTANVGSASFNKLNEYFMLYTQETPLPTFSYPNPTTVSDYIFFSSASQLRVINYYTAGYTPNRHVPLIVNFEIK
ncbi:MULTISPECIES: endonuclease/exonuclease/phosphatase family protein [Sphingobacterium]|uniref:endonuclease/exonuclease/phosphatase family protein n=1 Tax=Sphingobacterium TaxID=28453 RepID=UPI00257C6595|nr:MULTISPECIES: endonuclease/exonuclease/phosphatase family protein [Sphingobacterium]